MRPCKQLTSRPLASCARLFVYAAAGMMLAGSCGPEHADEELDDLAMKIDPATGSISFTICIGGTSSCDTLCKRDKECNPKKYYGCRKDGWCQYRGKSGRITNFMEQKCAKGPNGQGYCIRVNKDCARPGWNGVEHGDTYTYKGSRYKCHKKKGLVKKITCPPRKPVLLTPAGDEKALLGAIRPRYRWQRIPDVTSYRLWANNTGFAGRQAFDQWYEADEVCTTGSTCSVVPKVSLKGRVAWWVQPWNKQCKAPKELGPWSAPTSFCAGCPLAWPSVIAPRNGHKDTTLPAFSWREVAGATWYKVVAKGPGGGENTEAWYEGAKACKDGTCSAPAGVSSELEPGRYEWWILPWNNCCKTLNKSRPRWFEISEG